MAKPSSFFDRFGATSTQCFTHTLTQGFAEGRYIDTDGAPNFELRSNPYGIDRIGEIEYDGATRTEILTERAFKALQDEDEGVIVFKDSEHYGMIGVWEQKKYGAYIIYKDVHNLCKEFVSTITHVQIDEVGFKQLKDTLLEQRQTDFSSGRFPATTHVFCGHDGSGKRTEMSRRGLDRMHASTNAIRALLQIQTPAGGWQNVDDMFVGPCARANVLAPCIGGKLVQAMCCRNMTVWNEHCNFDEIIRQVSIPLIPWAWEKNIPVATVALTCGKASPVYTHLVKPCKLSNSVKVVFVWRALDLCRATFHARALAGKWVGGIPISGSSFVLRVLRDTKETLENRSNFIFDYAGKNIVNFWRDISPDLVTEGGTHKLHVELCERDEWYKGCSMYVFFSNGQWETKRIPNMLGVVSRRTCAIIEGFVLPLFEGDA